jgi:hypothetical protein
MPWETVIATVFQAGNLVVINPAGLFIYNGSPTLGNLLFSITNADGTDPYGNVYFKTATLYLGAAAINLDIQTGTPQLSFPTGAATEATPASIFAQRINTGLANEQIIEFFVGPESTVDNYRTIMEFLSSPHNAANTASGNIGIYQGNTQLARALNWDDRTGNFITMTPLLNGWVAGTGTVPRYRINAMNEVEIQGSLNSTPAFATTFFQLPTGYIPSNRSIFQMVDESGSNQYWGSVDTSGNLTRNGPSANQPFFFWGIIPLS